MSKAISDLLKFFFVISLIGATGAFVANLIAFIAEAPLSFLRWQGVVYLAVMYLCMIYAVLLALKVVERKDTGNGKEESKG